MLQHRLASLLGHQPCVLDGDDCLIGEGADEFDLPFGERLDPLAGQHDDTNRRAFAQQWHAKPSALYPV